MARARENGRDPKQEDLVLAGEIVSGTVGNNGSTTAMADSNSSNLNRPNIPDTMSSLSTSNVNVMGTAARMALWASDPLANMRREELAMLPLETLQQLHGNLSRTQDAAIEMERNRADAERNRAEVERNGVDDALAYELYRAELEQRADYALACDQRTILLSKLIIALSDARARESHQY